MNITLNLSFNASNVIFYIYEKKILQSYDWSARCIVIKKTLHKNKNLAKFNANFKTREYLTLLSVQNGNYYEINN